MRKILITGATGEVARATGKQLKDKGQHVIGVSRSVESDDPDFSETFQIDLLVEEDLDRLEEILDDVDAVFHLAWNKNAENFDTGKKWDGNLEIYRNIIEVSAKTGVPIFVNGSSIHAGTGAISAYTVEASLEDTPEPYKSSIDPDTDYDMRKQDPGMLLSPLEDNPDSPYGESKVETEDILEKAVEDRKFKLGVSIRIGGVNPDDKTELKGEPYYSSLYWSHGDLGRCVNGILTADLEQKKGYHQFYGVSDNEGRIFSIEDQFSF